MNIKTLRNAVFLLSMFVCALRAGDADLNVGQPISLPTKGYSIVPDVSFGGGHYFVVWQEGWHGLGGQADIVGVRVTPDGKVLDAKPIVINAAKGVQVKPKVTWNEQAKQFLVVWASMDNEKDFDVYATRVDVEGKVLDAEPIAVARVAGINEVDPVCASDGSAFLVAWSGYHAEKVINKRTKKEVEKTMYRIQARLISAEGKLQGEQAIAVAKVGHSPSIAFGGKNYLVAYRGRNTDGLRISTDGKLLDEEPLTGIACTGAAGIDLPSTAGTADGFFVVASRSPRPDNWGWGGPGVFTAGRVTLDGKLPESKHKINGWKWGLLCDDAIPNVIDSARWAKRGGEPAVKGWPKGAPGGFKAAYKNEWPSAYSAVASDGGKGWVVAWTLGHVKNVINVHNFDVRIRHVFPEDHWRKGPKIAAAETAADESMPALAKGSGKGLLLAYETIEEGKAPVVLVRLITLKDTVNE